MQAVARSMQAIAWACRLLLAACRLLLAACRLLLAAGLTACLAEPLLCEPCAAHCGCIVINSLAASSSTC